MKDQLVVEDSKIEEVFDAITKVELNGDTWTDDHILCLKALITLKDGTSHNLVFEWCGEDTFACVKYFNDSQSAKDDFKVTFKQRIQTAVEIYNEWLNLLQEYPDEVLDPIEHTVIKMLNLKYKE